MPSSDQAPARPRRGRCGSRARSAGAPAVEGSRCRDGCSHRRATLWPLAAIMYTLRVASLIRRISISAGGGDAPSLNAFARHLSGGGRALARTGSRCIAWCLVVLLAACSQFKVQSKQDPRVGVASLRTFAWLPKSEAEPADQDVQHRGFDRQIRADVDRALREKGYAPATDGKADFLLNYRVTSTPTEAMRGNPSLGGWGGWWMGWPG